MPIYSMTTLQLPAWFINDCDHLRWLWAAKDSAIGGQCKVAWRAVCRPQCLGGLGVLDLALLSRALRLHWLWHERVATDKPWLGLPVPCSDMDRELFAVATRVTLDDGKTASFWHNSWLGHAFAL